MNDDLTTRLRARAHRVNTDPLAIEAADRIEALEAQLAERDADDLVRSEEGRTDWDYEQKIAARDAESAEWKRLFTACHPIHLDGVVRARKLDAVIAEARGLLGGYILQESQDGGVPDPKVVAADDALARVSESEASPWPDEAVAAAALLTRAAEYWKKVAGA